MLGPGQSVEAQQTLEQITDEGWKGAALRSIAEGQVKAGRYTEAERTTRPITDSYHMAGALGSIAEEQAKAGQFTEAQRTAQTMTDADLKTCALRLDRVPAGGRRFSLRFA